LVSITSPKEYGSILPIKCLDNLTYKLILEVLVLVWIKIIKKRSPEKLKGYSLANHTPIETMYFVMELQKELAVYKPE